MYNKDKSKSPNEEDLHSGKDSHLSTSVLQNVEFHIRSNEVGHECEVGDKYYVKVPVEVTSKDKEMIRFRQMSHLEFEPMEGETGRKADMKLKKHIAENY